MRPARGWAASASNAPPAAIVSRPRLFKRLRLEAAREIGEILVGAVCRALSDDGFDRARADVLQRRERVADRAALAWPSWFAPFGRLAGELEGATKVGGSARKSTSDALTHGGLTAMPLRRASLANIASLSVLAISSVIDAARNSSRIVRLQIGGVIADQRIGGGVALVEAVARELVDQFEDVDWRRPF